MDYDKRKKLYRDMLRIRLIEERIADLYSEQEMRCPVHLSIGQEAVAVGACSALIPGDLVFSGHRSHAHYLAIGGNLKRMLAEIYGKAAGCSGGKGGSMHLTDRDAGFVGATPIVGSTIPIAVGAALSARMCGENKVVSIFFGDGATETGVFHESLNFAVLKMLPILFICENNFYSVYSPLFVRQPPGRLISTLAACHGQRVEREDGNDVDVVSKYCADAVAYARAGNGPVFLEFLTYRWREHCGPNYDNNIGYRTEEEFLEWKERDPLVLYANRLIRENILTTAVIEQMNKSICLEINEAFAFARISPFPTSEKVFDEVYA